MPTRKSRLGVHAAHPSKSAAQLVAAASIKCIVFVAPLGLEHNTETDDMRPGLYPAVPAAGSAIDFRETHGDIVGVTGVNYVPGSNVVTILATIMSFTPQEARDLDVAASFEYGIGETVGVGDGSGDEVRVDRRGLESLLVDPLDLAAGNVGPEAINAHNAPPAGDASPLVVDVLPHDQAPETSPLLPPAE